jgi:hypothetical protein
MSVAGSASKSERKEKKNAIASVNNDTRNVSNANGTEATETGTETEIGTESEIATTIVVAGTVDTGTIAEIVIVIETAMIAAGRRKSLRR